MSGPINPRKSRAKLKPLQFANIEIDRFHKTESLQHVHDSLHSGHATRLYFVNAHCVNIAQRHPEYRDALAKAEYVLNDGAGVEMAAKALKLPMPENLNGTDWIPGFFDHINSSSKKPIKIFLLGTKEQVLNKARQVFSQRWPNIEVVGVHHGFFDHDGEPMHSIAQSKPEIVLSVMGVPKQEIFLDRNWDELQSIGVKLGIAGGAIVDFLTDTVVRAPLWIQKIRMEWVFRLLQEPKRLFGRYILGNILFLLLLLKERLKRDAPSTD